MKFTAATILTALVCADAALAGLTHAERRHASRAARRGAARRDGKTIKSRPKISVSNSDEESENWAGAVLVGTDYTGVSGVVTVPDVSGGSSSTAGAAWVGIDGDTCDTAILQTGIDWYGDGTYDAWYEWYPEDSYNFDITISAGDSIKMTVTATSDTGGSAVIENLTTGESVTETFSDVRDGALCEYNAEWIVEDFEECEGDDCELVPFADFGSIEFTDCEATHDGETVDTSGATIIEMVQDNKVLVECSASGSTVSCSYE